MDKIKLKKPTCFPSLFIFPLLLHQGKAQTRKKHVVQSKRELSKNNLVHLESIVRVIDKLKSLHKEP